MNYTLRLIGGEEYEITQAEYDNILGKAGFVFINRLSLSLNMASVALVEPSGLGKKKIDRSKQLEARLHDGTRVIKNFGRWYCMDGAMDDDGKLLTEPDPGYYPEVKSNILPTPEEYETEFKYLAVEAWLPKLIARSNELDPRLLIDRSNRKTGGGFERIGPRDMPKIGGGDDAEPIPVLA